MAVVDVHQHVVPDFVLSEAAEGRGQFGLRFDRGLLIHPEGFDYPVKADFYEAQAKIDSLRRHGIDVGVLSLAPTLFFYEQGAEGVAFARRANDHLANLVAGREELKGLATLPLQDPLAAASELERAIVDLGLEGAEIGTTGRSGMPLDNPLLDVVFSTAERLAVPLFVHPYEDLSHTLFGDFYLANSIGNPVSTTLAFARLIHAGVLDKYPALTLILAHGGGCLAAVIGRMQKAFQVRSEPRRSMLEAPATYLRQVWMDTVTHSDEMLKTLVDLVGSDRLLLGTDLPFDMADTEPLPRLQRVGLDAAELGQQALRLFRLDSA